MCRLLFVGCWCLADGRCLRCVFSFVGACWVWGVVNVVQCLLLVLECCLPFVVMCVVGRWLFCVLFVSGFVLCVTCWMSIVRCVSCVACLLMFVACWLVFSVQCLLRVAFLGCWLIVMFCLLLVV